MKRAAEFFAGIGLVRLALELCGWDVVFANDIDPKKKQIYSGWFGDEHFRLGDIRAINPNSIPEITLATASFPCIDLSLAGNRAGLNGTHSSTIWSFLEIIQAMGDKRPPLVLLENVMGLLTSHSGSDLRDILTTLNRLGYACDLLSLDAAWFTPQSRPRLFVVGTPIASRERLPLLFDHPARPKALSEFIGANRDIEWNLITLPKLRKTNQNLVSIVERVDSKSVLWWDAARKQHIYKQISAKHREILEGAMRSRSKRYLTVYKRVRPAGCSAELRWDGLAGCLRTPRGGSSKQFIIEASKGQWKIRNMTAREYARLQGVPDDFPIRVNENAALLGFGDAVCVPVVRWIVKNYLNPQLERYARSRRYFAKGA